MAVPINQEEIKGIIGKTISNVKTVVNRANDVVIIIFFTDNTFTAIFPNPDESVINGFIELINLISN